MNNQQITVRRRRVISNGSNTEEAEYTVTSERPTGLTAKEAMNDLTDAIINVLDQRLPTQATSKPLLTSGPYDALPWKQSKRKLELSTIRTNENPTGLEKELIDKIKASNGRHRIGDSTYKLSQIDDGTQYIQRWRTA